MQKALAGFLPNGTLINRVANFYTATKPTTRVDGSALVIGDRWFNPTTRVEGFWNGTYWLGEPRYGQSVGNNDVRGAASVHSQTLIRLGRDFLESVEIYYAETTAGLSGSNFYTVTLSYRASDGILAGSVNNGVFVINAAGTTNALQYLVTVNQVASGNGGGNPLTGIVASLVPTGAPPNIRFQFIPVFREIL